MNDIKQILNDMNLHQLRFLAQELELRITMHPRSKMIGQLLEVSDRPDFLEKLKNVFVNLNNYDYLCHKHFSPSNNNGDYKNHNLDKDELDNRLEKMTINQLRLFAIMIGIGCPTHYSKNELLQKVFDFKNKCYFYKELEIYLKIHCHL